MNKFPAFQFYFLCLTAISPAYFFFKYPFSLGGSIAICFFILILIAFLLHQRELSSVFVMITIVLSGILVMNFLAYLENSKTTTLPYIVIFNLSLFCTISFLYWTCFWPIKLDRSLGDTQKKLKRQIQVTILAPSLLIGLIFGILSSLVVFDISRNDQSLYNSIPALRALYVGPAGIIFCFLISYVYLNKINDEDIRALISEQKSNLMKYDSTKIKKWYLSIFVVFVIIGSLIEIGSNMWPIWIETILLLGIMSLIIWKIYKHLFQSESLGGTGN